MTIRRIAPLAAIATLALAHAPAALAAAPPVAVALHQRSGLPLSYFKQRAKPGRSASVGTVELRNLTRRSITVLLDPLDAVTASTLGSAYQIRGLSIRPPATWTSLTVRRMLLRPRGRTSVPIFVRLPRGTAPGDYLSGIGVQVLTPATRTLTRGNVAIASVERYAVGLELTVPGPRHPLILMSGARVGRDPSGLSFSIFARNAGNVILQNVSGTALITAGQRVVARVPLGPGTFVTGTSIAYPIPTPREHPIEGTGYRVRVVMRYPGGIARLDVRLRFGHAQAVRQAAFDPKAPPVDGGGHFPPLPVMLGLVAAGLAVLASVVWKLTPRWRTGVVRSPERTVDALLAAARESREPLSLIIVSSELPLDPRLDLATVLRRRLRVSDRLCRVDEQSYVVLAPDTDLDTAEAIAADLRRQLERADGAGTNHPAVRVKLADPDAKAVELLGQIGRAPTAPEPVPTG